MKQSFSCNSRHKGSSLLIIVTISAVIISMIALSIAKLSQASLGSTSTSRISIQAQALAESTMNYISLHNYDEIISSEKAKIPNTDFSSSTDVLIETVTVENDIELEEKIVTVKIFKNNEMLPRYQLKKIFYENGSSQYVFNDNNPDNRISMGYDDNRIITKIDEDELKLLTNVTPTYIGSLNNLSDTGFYSGSNLGNAPDNGSYYIENIRHSASNNFYIDQKLTNFNTGKIYHRQCRNGIWSNWEDFGSDVAGDLSPNGWIRLSNGFLMQWGTYSNNKITFPVAFKSFAQVIPSATSQSNVWGASPHLSQPSTITLTGANLKSYYMTGQDANQWGATNASGRYIAVGM